MGNLLKAFVLETDNSIFKTENLKESWKGLITEKIDFHIGFGVYAAIVSSTTLLLMYLEKRKNRCLGCLNGRFALIVPVNFLEGRKKRKVIVAIFALATIEIMNMISTTRYTIGRPNYQQVFIKLVLTAFISLIFLPMLTCVNMASISSCMIGLIYTFIYIVNTVVQSVPAPTVSQENLVSELSLRVIVLPFAGPYIIYWFAKRLFRNIWYGPDKVEAMSERQVKYVKNLLLPKKLYSAIFQLTHESEGRFAKLPVISWFRKYVYHNIHGFRYSLSILISCMVGFLIITKFAIESMYSSTQNFIQLREMLKVKEEIMKDQQKIPNYFKLTLQILFRVKRPTVVEPDDDFGEIDGYSLYKSQYTIFYVAVLLALIFAYLMNSVTICHMLMAYRKNLIDIYRKKDVQNYLELSSNSNVDFVLHAIQFTGYQVAYLMWGFLIQLFVLTAVLVIAGEIIMLPLLYAFGPFMIWFSDWTGPILGVILVTRGAQWLLIRYFFLEDKGKTMALDNRKGFFIMMYIVFFYNIFTGIFSCLKRIFLGMVIGIYLVPRLDRCVLPKAFEQKDEGFKSYRCLLYLEAMQSNPVVRCFVEILAKLHYVEIENAIWRSYDYEMWHYNPDFFLKKRKARNRWFLLYTLVRNSSIVELRRHNLPKPHTNGTSGNGVTHFIHDGTYPARSDSSC